MLTRNLAICAVLLVLAGFVLCVTVTRARNA
jgi:hypothetical protein